MVELCGTYLHIQRPLIVISQDNLMLEQLPVEEKHLLNFDLSAQQQKKEPWFHIDAPERRPGSDSNQPAIRSESDSRTFQIKLPVVPGTRRGGSSKKGSNNRKKKNQ